MSELVRLRRLPFWPDPDDTSVRWQLLVLVVAACVCVGLSLEVRRLSQEVFAIANVTDNLAHLSSASSRGAADVLWLTELGRTLPKVEEVYDTHWKPGDNQPWFRPDDLKRTADAFIRRGGVQPDETYALQGVLGLLLDEFTSAHSRQQAALMKVTHVFYLVAIGFLVFAALLVARQRRVVPQVALSNVYADRFVFEHSPLSITLSDSADRIVDANPAFQRASGYSVEDIRGDVIRTTDSEQVETDREMFEELLESGCWQGEYRYRNKSGGVVSDNVLRVRLGSARDPQGILTLVSDVAANPAETDTDQKLMLWQAHHDNLTKLPNANLLRERLGTALENSSRNAKVSGAMLSIDIDGFNKVNDAVGHDLADRILIEAAMRFAMACDEGDTIARMGGDDFVILRESVEEAHAAGDLARRLLTAMAEPFRVDDHEVFLGVSIGIVLFPGDGDGQGDLMQKADAARGEAKRRGGAQFLYFESNLNRRAQRRMQLETHMRRALAQDEFKLVYQPMVNLAHNSVSGAEALLRWESPELGFVSPGEFVPVAEQTGLIVELGRWVVNEVQRQLQSWRSEFNILPRISVNVSALQLRSPLDAKQLLEELSGEFARHLTVEITESALASENAGTSMFLSGLKQQGLRVALDDFGTGYSSVAYLRDYEFDVLKIDKSFIDSICEVRDHSLVASIVAMSRVLGLQVVAEGVEDRAQLEQLQIIGCDYVQGYYFSKPLEAQDFADFYRQPLQQNESQ